MTNHENLLNIPDRLPGLPERVYRLVHHTPDMPPQDMPYNGDPEAYVDRVRNGAFASGWAENMFINPQDFGQTYSEQTRPLDPVLQEWRVANKEEIDDICEGESVAPRKFNASYWPFMPNMVRLIANAPRIVADLEVVKKRNALMGDCPSKKSLIVSRIQHGLITADQVETAEKIILNNNGKMKAPDFWRLPQEQQDEIIATIGRECLGFWRAFAQYGTPSQMESMYKRVLPGPVRLLEEAMAHGRRTELGPHMALAAFIQKDQAVFGALLKRFRKTKSVSGADDIQMLQSGERLQLNDGAPISPSALRTALGGLFSMVGYQLQQMQPSQSKSAFWRWRDPSYDPAEQLIGDHYGTITNASMTQAEVDAEFAKKNHEELGWQ